METIVEAARAQVLHKPNLLRSMEDLVRVVSVGTTEKGIAGVRALECEYSVYRIVAFYENTAGPPRADIATERRFFWSDVYLKMIEIKLEKLLVEGTPFITRTGDGSRDFPTIILRWERETIEPARL